MHKHLILFLPVAILLLSLLFCVYYDPGHAYMFSGRTHLIEESDQVFRFIRAQADSLPAGMSDREIEHLVDVRDRISLAKFLAFISALLAAGSFIRHKKGKQLRRGGVLTIGLSGMIGFGALVFDWVFEKFHVLMFSPGSWVFEMSDMLIVLYPYSFFETMFLSLFVNVLIAGLVTVLLGLLVEDSYYLLQ